METKPDSEVYDNLAAIAALRAEVVGLRRENAELRASCERHAATIAIIKGALQLAERSETQW